MRRWLRARLAGAERIAELPGTRWLAPWLARRELWRLERRGVALGLALGVFFGVLIPFAQILLAALAAVALRANVAAAALGTFVSNPFTTLPLYALAYGAGALALGADPMPDRIALSELGAPLAAGLALLATAGALAAYLLVQLAWRAAAWRRLHNMQGERP